MKQEYFDHWKRSQNNMRGMTQEELWRLQCSLMRDTSHIPSTDQRPQRQTATIDDKPVTDTITTTTLEDYL